MRPVDVKKSTLINFNDENNDKDPKLKVDGHVAISKCKNILQQASLQICQMFLLLKRLKIA